MPGGRRIPVTVEADTHGNFNQAADGLEKVALKAEETDASLGRLTKGHQALDAEIDKTAYSIKNLRSEFEKTGDIDLLKDASKLERTRAGLEKLRAQFVEVGQDAKGAGEGVRQASADLDQHSAKLTDLDRQMRETEQVIRDLSKAWVATRDVDVQKMLVGQRNALADLRAEYEKAKADVDKGPGLFSKLFALGGSSIPNSAIKAAESGGIQAGDAFSGGFLSAMAPVGIALGATIGPPLVAMLLADVGAAGLAIAGGGAIAAGVIAQFSDPRVHGAVTDLGGYLKGQLVESTSGFIGPMTTGIVALKREMSPFWTDLQQGFHSLEPYIGNLLVKIGQGMAMLGPGLGRAMQAAGPILGTIANSIPTLLNGVNIFFDEISKGGKGASEAIYVLIKGVSMFVAGLGFAIRFASDLFDVFIQGMDKGLSILSKIPGLGEAFKPLAGYVHGAATAFDQASLSSSGAAGGLDLFTGSADSASGAAGGLAVTVGQAGQSLQSFQGNMLSADQAAGQWRQGLLGLADGVKQHGKSLKENTTDGEANIQMLQDMVTKARSAHDANIAQGQSVAYADQQYQDNIQTLIDNAVHLGFNRQQVENLIGKYREIPGSVTTNVNTPGLGNANAQADHLLNRANDLDGRRVTTTFTAYHNDIYNVDYNYSSASSWFHGNRWGGAFEHAAIGKLRDASIYSAVPSGARYAFAEPATGGEAFIPKYGDRDRSMSILDKAASWYGAAVVPKSSGYASPVTVAGGRGGGGVAGPSAEAIAKALARELAPILAELADRPAVFSIDNQRIAQAVKQGNRGLDRRG